MVLKAKEVIVAILTPLDLVRVSNISAGTIQESGPFVAEKEKLNSQVKTINPQLAALLFDSPGGKVARRMVAMMNVRQFIRFPPIIAQRRPV